MNTLKTILQRFRDAYANRHEPETAAIFATTSWQMIVALMALAIVASLFFALVLLMNTLNSIYSQETGLPGVKLDFNKAELQATLSDFETRRANYESLKTVSFQIPDPSK